MEPLPITHKASAFSVLMDAGFARKSIPRTALSAMRGFFCNQTFLARAHVLRDIERTLEGPNASQRLKIKSFTSHVASWLPWHLSYQ